MTNLGFPILTMLRLLSISCTLTTVLAQSCCAVLNGSQGIVFANDTNLQYNPPLTDDTIWKPLFFNKSLNSISTTNHNASVSFEFQGSSMSIIVDSHNFDEEMQVTLDGSTSFVTSFTAKIRTGEAVVFKMAGLNSTVTHTAKMQTQALTPEPGLLWNILFVDIRDPSSSLPSPNASSNPLIPAMSSDSPQSSGQTSSTKDGRKSSSGTIIGAVVGALFIGAAIVPTFRFILRRRRQTSNTGTDSSPIHPSHSQHTPEIRQQKVTSPSHSIENGQMPQVPYDSRGAIQTNSSNRKLLSKETSTVSEGVMQESVNGRAQTSPGAAGSHLEDNPVIHAASTELPGRRQSEVSVGGSLGSAASSQTIFSVKPFGDGRISKYDAELL